MKIKYWIKNNYLFFGLILAFIWVFSPQSSLAENVSSGLPDIIVGQTEITAPGGQKYYAGLGGNEAVLNYEPGYLHGFDQSNFNPSVSPSCVSLPALPVCFILKFPSLQPTSIRLLSSRTYYDGIAELETATLLYPDNLISGDVYGFDNPNFNSSYFGRNLLLAPGSSDANAFWKLPNYLFNPRAQAYWTTGQLGDSILRLKSNAKALTSLPSGLFNGVCGPGIGASTCTNSDQFPEGRVWIYTGPVTTGTAIELGSDLTFYNKGTIIIPNGDLVINGNISYSSSASDSSIGFILENGSVIFRNFPSDRLKNIKASFFAPKGNIEVRNNNIRFIGSFVAEDFVTAAGGVSNISFIYDQRGETVWPPGFRELQIPSLLAK